MLFIFWWLGCGDICNSSSSATTEDDQMLCVRLRQGGFEGRARAFGYNKKLGSSDEFSALILPSSEKTLYCSVSLSAYQSLVSPPLSPPHPLPLRDDS